MGIQVGANYKGLGEIRLYMKMGCQDLLMDEACEGESDVMADFVLSMSNLVTVTDKVWDRSQFGEKGEGLVSRIRRSVWTCE